MQKYLHHFMHSSGFAKQAQLTSCVLEVMFWLYSLCTVVLICIEFETESQCFALSLSWMFSIGVRVPLDEKYKNKHHLCHIPQI